MKITPAARTVITPAIAIRKSTSCSISITRYEQDLDKAPAPGFRNRPKIAGGLRPADPFPQPVRNMPAAAAEGADDYGQQPVQWLAHGGCLAREETYNISFSSRGAVTSCRR